MIKQQAQKQSKQRLQESYKLARKQLQSVDIELNRSSIALINEKGELIRIPVLHEH
ncbi:hypothetical protein MACH09_42770 [Vibrio sp. MACH09]|uniref:hypothetical protein n=1 Tax=unclassified Vibrio TaxID=2614977 RepID=UPI0014937325|nr:MULTISPECIES: hypothetical protein [unclassified Vibrio]GLO63769.1 hypothetical protein MACH09_42770 [Vibrio sp. MACH09]